MDQMLSNSAVCQKSMMLQIRLLFLRAHLVHNFISIFVYKHSGRICNRKRSHSTLNHFNANVPKLIPQLLVIDLLAWNAEPSIVQVLPTNSVQFLCCGAPDASGCSLLLYKIRFNFIRCNMNRLYVILLTRSPMIS